MINPVWILLMMFEILFKITPALCWTSCMDVPQSSLTQPDEILMTCDKIRNALGKRIPVALSEMGLIGLLREKEK